MNPQVNGLGFCYIDQNGLLLFTSTTPSVIQFPFPQDIVRDLEIINKELLRTTLEALFKSNSLSPARYIFVLSSNLLYEKPFKDPKSEQTQKEIQDFLDNVPFEHTGTIIFESSESKMIATNKELYQTLGRIMETSGSSVECIIPAYILGVDVNQALAMNTQLLSELFHKATSLRQYSFLTDITPQARNTEKPKVVDEKSQEKEKETVEKKSNMRVFVLAGVFVLLLIVLGVLLFSTMGK